MNTAQKILIIGGVAGGASAAARARRLSETAEIILFERGEYISFANCGLPYHIAGTITNRDQLLIQTPQTMKKRSNIDVRINNEVLSINREKKTITVLDKKTNNQYQESYDQLILSPGASPIKPNLPGIENSKIVTLRNIPDMDKINQHIDTHNTKHAVVIGGGYIGLEMTEALHQRGLDISLIELSNQVMGPIDPEMATLLHQELSLNNIDLRLGISVTSFQEHNNKLVVNLSNDEKIETDLAILAIGVKPENKLAKESGLSIGKLGGILVNKYMQTSDPSIYAVGDAIEVTDFVSTQNVLIPLAGPANRQGRIAADNIFGKQSEYKNTQGTGICKVFNLTVGMTGNNEKSLKRNNIAYEKIYIHPNDHASYYPGTTAMTLKLLFDPNNGKVLGAQAIGQNGIDKRIDLLALAIRSELTVFNLADSELSYAPPYGSAKDPINYAGFVASNVINKDVAIFHTEEINFLNPNTYLVDVRTPQEFSINHIPNAINIPVDELRNRLTELPQEKEIYVYCKVGLRGYLATRILSQHGYRSKNLSGGFTTYLLANNSYQTMTKKIPSDIENMNKKIIDARGIQCPGPIQKLSEAIAEINPGELINILTTDPGFTADAPAWCHSTGNELVNIVSQQNCHNTTIKKGINHHNSMTPLQPSETKRKMTIVVFSGDFDKAMAAFIIANGAATMGYEPTLFFTFWGLNILRKKTNEKIKKTFIEKMFSRMMPRGAEKIALSKMHMVGMGTKLIKNIMKQKNVMSLPDLIEKAKDNNIHLVACSMSMDLMGIKQAELLTGVSTGGVASYLDKAGEGSLNLFI